MTCMKAAPVILTVVLVATVATSIAAATGQTDARLTSPVPATPLNAAAFVGEWTIKTDVATLALTIRIVNGTIVGDVTTQAGVHHATLKIAGTSLLAGYDFDEGGVSSDAVL